MKKLPFELLSSIFFTFIMYLMFFRRKDSV
jgi:hypothetical protein